MIEFFRLPHTPHRFWLGDGEPRDDKVLEPGDVDELLAGEVVVEEKVDGANLGFSVDDAGDLQAQNRGSYLQRESAHPQFRPLWSWLAPRREGLVDALFPDLILFGEWCYATHSVAYTRLPDWFLGFDVYDRAAGQFWDSTRRDELLRDLGLAAVPRLFRGRATVPDLVRRLGKSSLADGPMEGAVVRREEVRWTAGRAKLVNAGFTQAIEAHWSRGPLRPNQLSPGAAGHSLQR